MPKVLVCDTIHSDCIELMKKSNIEVEVKPNLTPQELKAIAKNCDGIIVRSKTHITKDVIESAVPNLKVISRVGVGLDNIDQHAARRFGVKILSTPRATSQTVAEFTIGLMISVARQISQADSSTKRGEWLKSKFSGIQLAGRTLGIIGLGRIGLKVAQIAKAMGMKILVYDILLNEKPKEEKQSTSEFNDVVSHSERCKVIEETEAEIATLEKLLAESDVITLHVPLTEKTDRLIGEKEFMFMRKKPILINTARGRIVDEKALLEALKSGKISGAGLDVYETEPPKSLELLSFPNVVCTPHIAAQTEEAQREAGLQATEKIVKFFTKR